MVFCFSSPDYLLTANRNRFPFSNTTIWQRLQCALGNAVQTKVFFIYFIPQASNDLRQALFTGLFTQMLWSCKFHLFINKVQINISQVKSFILLYHSQWLTELQVSFFSKFVICRCFLFNSKFLIENQYRQKIMLSPL